MKGGKSQPDGGRNRPRFQPLLTSILGNAQLVADALPDDSPLGEQLDGIIESGMRAADVTRQMLDYSGNRVYRKRTICLNKVIRQVSRLVRGSVSGKTDLIIDLSQDLPAIHADATQISQVVLNLITNASEAIGDGAGSITITTSATTFGRPDPGFRAPGTAAPFESCACLKIADTGRGIDRDVRERLFDPFFTTKEKGRGLGLASVLGIVNGHRGAIGVTSEPGKGTTFSVLIPASAEPALPEPAAAQKTADATGSGLILVADDEEGVLDVLVLSLRQAGFTTVAVRNGREAVEAFRRRSGKIDAVLLDLDMPEMNGVEALRAIRGIRDSVPVMITSGYPEEVLHRQMGEDRPTRFIPKPLLPDELARIVKSVLAERSATD